MRPNELAKFILNAESSEAYLNAIKIILDMHNKVLIEYIELQKEYAEHLRKSIRENGGVPVA